MQDTGHVRVDKYIHNCVGNVEQETNLKYDTLFSSYGHSSDKTVIISAIERRN